MCCRCSWAPAKQRKLWSMIVAVCILCCVFYLGLMNSHYQLPCEQIVIIPPSSVTYKGTMKQPLLTTSEFTLQDIYETSPSTESVLDEQVNLNFNSEPKNLRTFNVNFKLGRWDNRRLYKFFDFALAGEKFSEISSQYDICLATQSSLERLHSLVQVSNHWAGTISLSVFIAGNEFSLVEFYVSYLRQCFPDIRDKVSFHLAFSPDHPPSSDPFNFIISQDCSKPEEVLKQLVQFRSKDTTFWRNFTVYPQNHLRNLARKNCQTSYVFLTDVDIIPCNGLAEKMHKFLKTNKECKLCAYVIPVYELSEDLKFPRNKSELIGYGKQNLARPFHEKVYKPAQTPTDYKRWESTVNNETQEVHVNHNVIYKDWYEPFFIAPDTAPAYDERFIGYGFTRNTQVYEMNAAKYQFKVLSPVFAIHWKLQTQKEDYNALRRRQLSMNSKMVSTFKNEVKSRWAVKKPKLSITFEQIYAEYQQRKKRLESEVPARLQTSSNGGKIDNFYRSNLIQKELSQNNNHIANKPISMVKTSSSTGGAYIRDMLEDLLSTTLTAVNTSTAGNKPITVVKSSTPTSPDGGYTTRDMLQDLLSTTLTSKPEKIDRRQNGIGMNNLVGSSDKTLPTRDELQDLLSTTVSLLAQMYITEGNYIESTSSSSSSTTDENYEAETSTTTSVSEPEEFYLSNDTDLILHSIPSSTEGNYQKEITELSVSSSPTSVNIPIQDFLSDVTENITKHYGQQEKSTFRTSMSNASKQFGTRKGVEKQKVITNLKKKFGMISKHQT